MTQGSNDCPVLVAEDDPSIRALIASALRRRMLNLATVTNGDTSFADFAADLLLNLLPLF